MSKKKNLTVNFENTLSELEKIVSLLESGDLKLEEALTAFEKGIQLAQEGQQQLKQAEQRVQILLDEHNDTLSPFNISSESND